MYFIDSPWWVEGLTASLGLTSGHTCPPVLPWLTGLMYSMLAECVHDLMRAVTFGGAQWMLWETSMFLPSEMWMSTATVWYLFKTLNNICIYSSLLEDGPEVSLI